MKNGKYFSGFSTPNLLEAIIFANMKRKELFGEFATQENIEKFPQEEILQATQKVLEKINKKNNGKYFYNS